MSSNRYLAILKSGIVSESGIVPGDDNYHLEAELFDENRESLGSKRLEIIGRPEWVFNDQLAAGVRCVVSLMRQNVISEIEMSEW